MNVYLIIAIVIIVGLVVLFIASFAMNKKVPVPDNCKDMFDENTCTNCKQYDCAFHVIEEKKENKDE